MRKWLYLLPVVLLLLVFPTLSQTKTHNVTLTWTPGANDVTFNVYRSTTSGSGYTKINTSTVVSANYVDTTGTGGTQYFYVVTGVDSSGVESADSNQASATFLAPPAAPTGLAAVSN